MHHYATLTRRINNMQFNNYKTNNGIVTYKFFFSKLNSSRLLNQPSVWPKAHMIDLWLSETHILGLSFLQRWQMSSLPWSNFVCAFPRLWAPTVCWHLFSNNPLLLQDARGQHSSCLPHNHIYYSNLLLKHNTKNINIYFKPIVVHATRVSNNDNTKILVNCRLKLINQAGTLVHEQNTCA